MESKNDCLYVLFPKSFSKETVKQILQVSLAVSNTGPQFAKDPAMQTFTEEDVKNFGLDALCKKSMAPNNSTSCTVLRIPKAYLGLDPQSNLEVSPILDQIKGGRAKGINEDTFFVKNNLIHGVYYPNAGGYVKNPNYSPVCDCYGVLTEKQKAIIQSKINSGDKNSEIYSRMLALDARVRNECNDSFYGGVGKELKHELDNLYRVYAVNAGIHTAVSDWSDNNTRRKITNEEFNSMIGRSQGM